MERKESEGRNRRGGGDERNDRKRRERKGKERKGEEKDEIEREGRGGERKVVQ